MAGEKKTQAKVTINIEKELHDASLRILEFEHQIQSGEADEYDDASIEKRRAIKEQSRKLLKYRSDFQAILARPDGRRVIYRILALLGPNRLSPNISDPYITAEANGLRRGANEVLSMVYDADPNAYAQMIREHVSDEKTETERKNREMESAPQ